MKNKFTRCQALLLIFVLNLAIVPFAQAQDPMKSVNPPKGWVWDKDGGDEPQARTMYVKKVGKAVSIRLHTYVVPVPANKFLDQVRKEIMAKKDYEGAEVKLVADKTIDGQVWSAFTIRRKDDINQEILGKKVAGGGIYMVIYTAAGTFFEDFYGDLKEVLKQSPQ